MTWCLSFPHAQRMFESQEEAVSPGGGREGGREGGEEEGGRRDGRR